MPTRDSAREILKNAPCPPGRARRLAFAAALAALLALPARAGGGSASWWQLLLGAFGQATLGEDPEGGLSIEPGG